jgi:VRR-NUC domain
MKQSESILQQQCVKWFRLQYPDIMLISIKNSSKMGGKKTKTGVPLEAIRAKKEGVTAGVADLMILNNTEFHGAIFIELKTKNGKQSKKQREFEMYCFKKGYYYLIIKSLEEFIETINYYLI